jgi:hypothetical protein
VRLCDVWALGEGGGVGTIEEERGGEEVQGEEIGGGWKGGVDRRRKDMEEAQIYSSASL